MTKTNGSNPVVLHFPSRMLVGRGKGGRRAPFVLLDPRESDQWPCIGEEM